ncbi:MAG: hypothetical protein ABIU95_02380 [Burkholderiales bacterium]
MSPATILLEAAHAVVGPLTGARPSSFNLWPQRVGATAWRLGYVGFLNLRWWNGGAVALAPLCWLLVIVGLGRVLAQVLMRGSRALPTSLPLSAILALGVCTVWLWIAVAPGRTDWTLALLYWPSSLVFAAAWGAVVYGLVLWPTYPRRSADVE